MALARTVLSVIICVCLSYEQAAAGEALLKIGSIDTAAFEQYIAGNSFFSGPAPEALPGLATALSQGITDTQAYGDNSLIDRNSLVPARMHEPLPALQNLFPGRGRIVGRQLPGGTSGWHKYIIEYPDEGPTDFFAEVMASDVDLQHLAAKGSDGSLQQWNITQRPPVSGEINTAFSTGYYFFTNQLTQGNAREWLSYTMPRSSGVGLMALRQFNQEGTASRTGAVIIRLDPTQLATGASGLPETEIVLAWRRAAVNPPPAADNTFE